MYKQVFLDDEFNVYNATTNKQSECEKLPIKVTYPLAPNWENIPETVLINGFIFIILLGLFWFLTRKAWRDSETSSSTDYCSYTEKGLIEFLYNYRDPSRWSDIPRLEFMRRTKLRHSHDLDYPNIYMPPKLPSGYSPELFGNLANDNNPEDLEAQEVARNSLIANSKTTFTQQQARAQQIETRQQNDLAAAARKNFSELFPDKKNKSQRSIFYPSILTAEQLQASYLSRKLNLFFSKFFKVTDADIIYAKGIDAYEYLLFQRHLILILVVVNIICLIVILPVNWFGGNIHNRNPQISRSYTRTTIKNIEVSSQLYWCHIAGSLIISILSHIILQSYRNSTIAKQKTQLSRRTLLLGNIPKNQRNRAKLTQILREYFPRSSLEAIQFVYETYDLENEHLQLDCAVVAKDYCVHYKHKNNGKEMLVKTTDVNENEACGGYMRMCSFCFVCCCYWPFQQKVSGIQYYTQTENKLRLKIRETCHQIVRNPTEHAFVTFKTHRQSKSLMEELAKLKSDAINDRMSMSLVGLHLWHSAESRASKSQQLKQLQASPNADTESPPALATKSSKSPKPQAQKLKDDQQQQQQLQSVKEFVTSDNVAPSDPLSLKNNPRVKSIRSPILNLSKLLQSKDQDSLKSDPTKLPLQTIGIHDGPIPWSVRYAPHPDNVEYGDLLIISHTTKARVVLLHFVMIIIFIFFTTPAVLLSIFERSAILRSDSRHKTGLESIAINYITVLLQIATTALLPNIIILISKSIPYEDSSTKDHSIMWKSYLFLILMVIIFPSIGMTSFEALFQSNIKTNCLFPVDNGAYFINYVTSSAFLSTVLELIKPADIVFYGFIYTTSRSSADFERARSYVSREFACGMAHTGTLLIFSVVMTYTISCPIISIFGLVYMIIKHCVDHYNLFYTYFTKKVDRNTQDTIECFVKVSILLMQFQTTMAITINTGTSYFSLISQIVFWISLAIFLNNCFFEYTSRALINNSANKYHKEFCACYYLPRVFDDLQRLDAVPESCFSRKT